MSKHDEAADPQTPPERLRELGNTGGPSVREVLARNPNLPPGQLVEFLQMEIEGVFSNPVLPLLILTQPELLSPLTTQQLRWIVTHPKAARDLLLMATQLLSIDQLLIQDEARLHINLTGELGAGWQAQAIDAICALPHWERLHPHLALCDATPALLLDQLAQHPDWRIRDKVARNPAIGPAVQRRLATDGEPAVRYNLARNAALDSTAERLLNDDRDPALQALLARRDVPRQVKRHQAQPWQQRIIKLGRRKIKLGTIVAALTAGPPFQSLLAATVLLYPPPYAEDLYAVDTFAFRVPRRFVGDQDEFIAPVSVTWIERLLLAAHSRATTIEQLRILAGDPNAIVRAAASERLALQEGR